MKKQCGFTLVEVLIVILIIGIVIAAVSFSIQNSGRGQTVQSTANILRSRMLYAEQQALMQSFTFGIGFSQKGYQFYRYQSATASKPGQWQLMNDDPAMAFQAWPKPLTVSLQLPGNPETLIPDQLPSTPMLVFSTDGGVTPFRFSVGHYVLIGKYNGEISFEK